MKKHDKNTNPRLMLHVPIKFHAKYKLNTSEDKGVIEVLL